LLIAGLVSCKHPAAASTRQQDISRGGMTQLTYHHWSRAISAVPDGPPPHQRSRIRLQCGGGARSQWLLVVRGVGHQLQLPTAVRSIHHGVDGLMSYYSYLFSGGLFVRIRIDYSYHYSEANTKRIFGTALIHSYIFRTSKAR